MAIKHYINKKVRFVSSLDDAPTEASFERYRNEGYEYDHLEFESGESPSVFHLKQLEHDAQVEVMSMTQIDAIAAAKLAFRIGVESIDNFESIDLEDSNRPIPLKSIDRVESKYGKIIDEDWMRVVRFDVVLMAEIGKAIIAISVISKDAKKKHTKQAGDTG